MRYLKFKSDWTINRLRQIMVGTIIFDMIITLISQPETYWHDPNTAFESNSMFHFFLTNGVFVNILIDILYILIAFVLVSALPKVTAMITSFSFILAHYFRASCWLDYSWHMNMAAPLINGIILAMIIFPIFSAKENDVDKIVKKLRWLLLGTMLFDMTSTILGQPASYWQHHEITNESFALSRFFLSKGMFSLIIYDILSFSAIFLLITVLPKKASFIGVFSIILCYFFGGSTWLNGYWNFSADGPIIYGMIISMILIFVMFNKNEETNMKVVRCIWDSKTCSV